MTDVIPDEIQPDGSGTSDPGPEATLEETPSAAAAAEPAMPSVSEATTDAAETTSPAETSSAEASFIETAAASPAASSPEPVSTPAAPEPAPQTSSDSPSLEASTSVPPASDATATGDGGGEWELLLAKLQGWLGSGQLRELWSQARRPLNLVLAAVALLLVLRVYTGLIEAINGLPLVAGLLELVGLIWAVRCGLPRLLQSSAREQLLQDLQQRWRSFSGRG